MSSARGWVQHVEPWHSNSAVGRECVAWAGLAWQGRCVSGWEGTARAREQQRCTKRNGAGRGPGLQDPMVARGCLVPSVAAAHTPRIAAVGAAGGCAWLLHWDLIVIGCFSASLVPSPLSGRETPTCRSRTAGFAEKRLCARPGRREQHLLENPGWRHQENPIDPPAAGKPQ